MALDGLLMHKLANELDEKLRNVRLDKIQQPSHYELLLRFSFRGNSKLLINTNPSNTTCHFSTASFVNPKIAPRFTMYLRKHLQGARVQRVYSPDYERVLIFEFIHIDELQDEHHVKLIVELMNRQSNVILVNDKNIIMDSLIHVDAETSRYRLILPKQEYKVPPIQNKPLIEDRIQELETGVFELSGIDQSKSLDRELLNLCLGLSPLLVNEILYRSMINGKRTFASLNDDEKSSLLKTTLEYLRNIYESKDAYIFPNASNGRGDYHCVKLSSLGNAERIENISTAIDTIYNRRSDDKDLSNKRSNLLSKLRKEIKHQEKLVDVYFNDIRKSENFDDNRRNAELILSQLYSINEKEIKNNEINLIDYYDPDMNEITIKLDPKLNLAQNANKFFKTYNKQKDTLNYAKDHIEATEENVNYLYSIENLLENSDSVEDLLTIENEMLTGPFKKKFAKVDKKSKKGPSHTEALPPREYETSNGLKIYAGRNNHQNDRLTFRFAQKDDLWFHAKNVPGTHLILTGDNPEDSDILEAAQIAAYLSLKPQQREMASIEVEIDYCPVSNVKKPSGSKPGFVIYDNYKTIIAEANQHKDLEIQAN